MQSVRAGCLLLFTALLVAGCGAARHSPSLLGTWSVNGVVESENGADNIYPGERYLRTWIIYEGCWQGRCGTWLARQVSGGPTEYLMLERDGDRLVSTLHAVTDGCIPGTTGKGSKHFVFNVEHDGTLNVTESTFGAYPGCSSIPGGTGYVIATTVWHAHRIMARCPGTAPSCRFGHAYPIVPQAPS